MWGLSVLLLLTMVSAHPSPYYKYKQVIAITPAPTAAPDNTTLPYDALLQDVFGLPGMPAATEPPEHFKPSYETYDEFDWRLTKLAAPTTAANLLLCPLGLKLALAVLAEGATGTTAAELQFTLGLHANTSRTHAKFDKILNSLLTKSEQYTLDLGSRIYIGNRTEPKQKFAATAEQHYKTDMKKADFDQPAAAVLDINSWISNVTHGRIPKLVSENDLDGAVMLILNSLYFKGTWLHQFDSNNTRIDTFYPSPTNVVLASYMRIERSFFFVESARMQAKILRLPYVGNKFAMYIIVPNSITGITQVLKELTSEQLRQEIAFLRYTRVRLMLPRFQFEYASVLDAALKELGIRHAFEQTASFPGISRGEGTDMIRISKVLQKSGIEVNELGSVVYSATEVALTNRFGDEDDSLVEVRANKPFLFYIEDETTRQLLFTGRVSNPTAVTAS